MDPKPSKNSVATSVKRVIISVLDLDMVDLDDSLSLYSDDIGMDSLTLLHVITRIEQELSFQIEDEVIMSATLVTVGDLVELVSGLVGGEPADTIDTTTAGRGTGQ